jgi:hypothetical protein
MSITLPANGTATIVISGSIPGGRNEVVLIEANATSGAGSPRQFKFSAPASPSPVGYALNFCVGPASNPCAGPAAHIVVNVPAGQERTETINTDLFKTNVLIVSQGTAVPVAFAVQID